MAATAGTQTWSAPGRVNLIGDHTDYNDGFALPFALPQRTTVVATPRTDGRITATSGDLEPADFADDTTPGDVSGWAAYVAGIAWVLGEHLGAPLAGADLAISSEVPRGGGLSSSHSLECAVALALLGLAGEEVPREELALLVQRAENDYVGAPTGLLDQTAILRSQADHLSFFDARDRTVEPVPCDLDAAGLTLLVIDPHAPHVLTDGGYARGATRASGRRPSSASPRCARSRTSTPPWPRSPTTRPGDGPGTSSPRTSASWSASTWPAGATSRPSARS